MNDFCLIDKNLHAQVNYNELQQLKELTKNEKMCIEFYDYKNELKYKIVGTKDMITQHEVKCQTEQK